MEHPKDIGNGSTLAIMTALSLSGVALYVPFGENTRCDLIIDRGGELIRLQCKTGRLRGGAIRFAPRSSYGHHRNPQTARRDYRGQVDYFAVYCAETTGVYLIPTDEAPRRHPPATVKQSPPTEGLRVPSGA